MTHFPPSNYSKSKNKNVYIIIANGYTTKQDLEVSKSRYLTRGRKKKLCVRKHEAGEGLGAKSDETERNGSVSGTPCETAVEGDGVRWWDEVDKVVVVVGLCIRKCEAGGGLGPNPTKPSMMAWFWARHAKRQWRTMGGGGGTRWIR